MSAALQKAVIETLRAALSCKVYDEVPRDAAMPYVVLDSIQAANADGLTARRERVMVYLSVWAEGVNALGVLGILADIKAALHNTKPTLDTGRCAIIREARRSTDRDIDRAVRIGRATYEAHIAP